MDKSPSFTVTNESVTVVLQGKAYTVQRGSPHFQALKQALHDKDWDEVTQHLTIQKSLSAWAKGRFTLKEDTIYYDNVPVSADLNVRILNMHTQGESPAPLFRFWERLQKNPSFRSVQQLWKFLEHHNIPLTPDGCFLAYKAVRSDYKDKHSGTVGNRPNTVNEMPRNLISDDPNVACHDGFHVGALGYVKSFGKEDDRIIVCKVDPEHVVCVPFDESQQKMRVCKYLVVGNYGTPLPSTVFEEKEEVDKQEVTITVKPRETIVETEKSSTGKEKKKVPKKEFAKFARMGTVDLLKQSIENLRRYATYGLLIVGASKIPGGKTALISSIMKARA